jgi:hypothetical protein
MASGAGASTYRFVAIADNDMNLVIRVFFKCYSFPCQIMFVRACTCRTTACSCCRISMMELCQTVFTIWWRVAKVSINPPVVLLRPALCVHKHQHASGTCCHVVKHGSKMLTRHLCQLGNNAPDTLTS